MKKLREQLNLYFILIPKLITFLVKDFGHLLFLILKASWQRKPWIIISLVERFGDIIAAEPILRKIESDYPGHFKIWLVNRKLKNLAKCYPYNYAINTIKFFDEWIIFKKILPQRRVIDLNLKGRFGIFSQFKLDNKNAQNLDLGNYYEKGNLLHTFGLYYPIDATLAPIFLIPADTKLPVALAKLNAVIHTQSDEPARNWNTGEWEKLISYLFSKRFKIYEIGHKQSSIEHEGLIHCQSLSIEETALLIKRSNIFLGVDSGPAHLANAMGTFGIIFLGKYRHYEKYMPYSGNYQNGKNATVIHYPSLLSEMKFEEIKNQIDVSLSKFEYLKAND